MSTITPRNRRISPQVTSESFTARRDLAIGAKSKKFSLDFDCYFSQTSCRARILTGGGSLLACFGKLWTARSLLYQRRFLQPNTHFAAFFEIYTIFTLLHRSKLRNSAKFRQNFSKISENFANFVKFHQNFTEFSAKISRIFAKF